MENPPPYDQKPLLSSTTSTNTSTTVKTSSEPSFHIRQTTPNDAPAVRRIDEHCIAHSPRATRETAASLDVVKSSILDPSLQNLVQILAVPIAPPNHGSSISGLVRKFKNYTVEKTPKAAATKSKTPDITNGVGILGYAILLPYTDGIKGPTKCYYRTASLFVFSLGLNVIGEGMYWDVNRALIDEAMERSREQGDRFKTVLTSFTFSEEEMALVKWREVLLDRGFVQVACLKGVVEKWGKVMDRVYLQKNVEVEAAQEESQKVEKEKGTSQSIEAYGIGLAEELIEQ